MVSGEYEELELSKHPDIIRKIFEKHGIRVNDVNMRRYLSDMIDSECELFDQFVCGDIFEIGTDCFRMFHVGHRTLSDTKRDLYVLTQWNSDYKETIAQIKEVKNLPVMVRVIYGHLLPKLQIGSMMMDYQEIMDETQLTKAAR